MAAGVILSEGIQELGALERGTNCPSRFTGAILAAGRVIPRLRYDVVLKDESLLSPSPPSRRRARITNGATWRNYVSSSDLAIPLSFPFFFFLFPPDNARDRERDARRRRRFSSPLRVSRQETTFAATKERRGTARFD